MRRKKRYGVYSNHTIKRCHCLSGYCRQCKGVCKTMIPGEIDPIYNWHSVKEYYASSGRPQVHRYGFGSLYPGRKFVMYEKNHGFKYRRLKYEAYLRLQERKKAKRENLKSEMMEVIMHESIKNDIKRREEFFFEADMLSK
ncbi:hypothetical protein SteCoe_17193 [Stentor coeruleus]|uniref:Uncharacterized protein n=1 Tax=Stentor coeruleus TaxID=5963 RepID=A0A1R2BZG8_9CILI|nr:hypothetical protein SteCoe_17193 [Stentor coeruleus]